MQRHRPVVRHFVTGLRWRLYLGNSVALACARSHTNIHQNTPAIIKRCSRFVRYDHQHIHILSPTIVCLCLAISMHKQAFGVCVCVWSRELWLWAKQYFIFIWIESENAAYSVPDLNRCGRNVDKTVWGRKNEQKKGTRTADIYLNSSVLLHLKKNECLDTCNCMCGNSIECVPLFCVLLFIHSRIPMPNTKQKSRKCYVQSVREHEKKEVWSWMNQNISVNKTFNIRTSSRRGLYSSNVVQHRETEKEKKRIEALKRA